MGAGGDGDSRRWCATEMGTRLGDWILKMVPSAVSLPAFLAWVVCGLPTSSSWSWGALLLSGRSGEGHQVALTNPPLSKRVTFVMPWPFIQVSIFFSNSSPWAQRSLTKDGDCGGEDTLWGFLKSLGWATRDWVLRRWRDSEDFQLAYLLLWL